MGQRQAKKKAAAGEEQWVPVAEFAESLGLTVEELKQQAAQGRHRLQDFWVPADGSAPIPMASLCGRKPPGRAVRHGRRKAEGGKQ